jgi:hypothetical protein
VLESAEAEFSYLIRLAFNFNAHHHGRLREMRTLPVGALATHMEVGNAASHKKRLLSRDAFAVSYFPQGVSLMLHLRNPDRQQNGFHKGLSTSATRNGDIAV